MDISIVLRADSPARLTPSPKKASVPAEVSAEQQDRDMRRARERFAPPPPARSAYMQRSKA